MNTFYISGIKISLHDLNKTTINDKCTRDLEVYKCCLTKFKSHIFLDSKFSNLLISYLP